MIQPKHGKRIKKKLALKIPETLPDGTYQLVVGGAYVYSDFFMMANNHKFMVENVDELLEAGILESPEIFSQYEIVPGLGKLEDEKAVAAMMAKLKGGMK